MNLCDAWYGPATLPVRAVEKPDPDYFNFDRMRLILKLRSWLAELSDEVSSGLLDSAKKCRTANMVTLIIGKLYNHCLGVVIRIGNYHVKIVVIRLFLECGNYASYFDRHRLNAVVYPRVGWQVGRMRYHP